MATGQLHFTDVKCCMFAGHLLCKTARLSRETGHAKPCFASMSSLARQTMLRKNEGMYNSSVRPG